MDLLREIAGRGVYVTYVVAFLVTVILERTKRITEKASSAWFAAFSLIGAIMAYVNNTGFTAAFLMASLISLLMVYLANLRDKLEP